MSTITEFYNGVYMRLRGSPTYRTICCEAFEEEHDDRFCRFSFAGRHEHDSYIELARRENASRVLELGCGYGGLATSLAMQLAVEVVALDSSAAAIDNARAFAAQQQMLGRVCFEVGDVDTCQVHHGLFDAVFAIDVIQHFRDKRACLKRVAQWLRRNGIFRFSGWFEHDIGHENIEEGAQGIFFEALREHGFCVQNIVFPDPLMRRQLQFYSLVYREREKLSLEVGQEFISMLLREYVYLDAKKGRISRCDITVRKF